MEESGKDKYDLILKFNYSNYVKDKLDTVLFDEDFIDEIEVGIFCEVEDDESFLSELAKDSTVEHSIRTFKLGYAEIHYYNLNYAFERDFYSFEVFSRSMHTVEIGSVLLQKNGFIKDKIIQQIGYSRNNNILVIQDFEIHQKFREKGIGYRALSGLINRYRGKAGYAALHSYPKAIISNSDDDNELLSNVNEQWDYRIARMNLDEPLEKDLNQSQKKLNSFFEKIGFTKIKGTKNYYIINLDPE
jgi:GNAT superfamily N-acetyltransferase